MRSKFVYHCPASPEAAYELKKQLGPGAVYWAGGTDLLLQWARGVRQVDHCIDLGRLGMDKIIVEPGLIRIGAGVKLADLAAAGELHPLLRVLAATASLMATPQVRTLATVAGNICNAVPSADLSAPLLALDATLVTTEARRPIDGFFVDVRKTALSQDELVLEIEIPAEDDLGASYRRTVRSSVDISLTGAAAALKVGGGRILWARVALNAVAPTPVRAAATESYLTGKALASLDSAALREAGALALESIKPITDLRASREFRSYAAAALVELAITEAAACFFDQEEVCPWLK